MKCYQLCENSYYNTFDTFRISEAEIHPLLPRQQKHPFISDAAKHPLLHSKENIRGSKTSPDFTDSKIPFTSEAAKQPLTSQTAKHPLLKGQRNTPYLGCRLLLPLPRGDARGPGESVVEVLVTHHGEVGVPVAGVAHVTRQQV